MDFEIAGISFYYIISWFLIYSFLGWVWESVYVSVKKKKLVNRGFINGPLCTIYGLGAVAVYLILKPFDENLLILYVGGVVTATVLEYITGWLMEKIFHTRWWDYSSKKYNLHGYICLGSSVAWGFFTLLLFYVLQPFVSWITDQYPVYAGRIVVAVVSALYLADFSSSAAAAFGLSKAFGKAEDLLEELSLYLQNSKLYATKEEIRDKLESGKIYPAVQGAKERYEVRKQEFLRRFETLAVQSGLPDTESYLKKRQELEARLDEFGKKYLDMKQKQNRIKKRMVSAYPELKNHFRRYREKQQKKQKK